MKTLVLSMISIAATVAAMTACTSESDPIDDLNPKDAKVEIKATAGVGIVTTKAPVDNTFTSNLDVLFFKPADAATTDWTTGDQICATIASAAGHDITFKEAVDGAAKVLYYNADGTLKSYLAACYLGNAASTDDLKDGSITFSIDGTQDIMATKGQQGSINDAFEEFAFEHLLAQLEFVIKPANDADKVAIQNTFGKVTKIELLGQDTQFDLALGLTPTLAVNKSADNKALAIDKQQDIDGNVFGQLMIFPTETLGQTDNLIKLKVYTANNSKGYSITAKIGEGAVKMEKSKKYTITISFTNKDVDAKGSIGEWATGGDGTTNI